MRVLVASAGVAAVAAVVVLLAGSVSSQTQTFSDVSPSHEHYEAVEWAAAAGITEGWGDGTFRPDRALPQIEAVIFLERFYSVVVPGGPPSTPRDANESARLGLHLALMAPHDPRRRAAAAVGCVGAAQPGLGADGLGDRGGGHAGHMGIDEPGAA